MVLGKFPRLKDNGGENLDEKYKNLTVEPQGDVESISDSLRHLLDGILNPNNAQRIKIDDIWEHDWFKVGLPTSNNLREFNNRLLDEYEPDFANSNCDQSLTELTNIANAALSQKQVED